MRPSVSVGRPPRPGRMMAMRLRCKGNQRGGNMQCLLCGAEVHVPSDRTTAARCRDCGATYVYDSGTALAEVPSDIKALIRRYLVTKAGNLDPAMHETRETHE